MAHPPGLPVRPAAHRLHRSGTGVRGRSYPLRARRPAASGHCLRAAAGEVARTLVTPRSGMTAPRPRLPAQPGTRIGRAADVARVQELLQREDVRLLTLV